MEEDHEFETSLEYGARPCLKKNKQNQKKQASKKLDLKGKELARQSFRKNS
jgi:hypothetical protein